MEAMRMKNGKSFCFTAIIKPFVIVIYPIIICSFSLSLGVDTDLEYHN